ncbi:MAG TPA: monovalent cation/H+ antiporter complex subunit F [Humibacillus sp.]|nr:monovalent cation/H+ antiporter complex subunit F [Humibacillus sp.]
MTVVALLALALLGSAAAIVLVRLFRGPTNLDRIVAAEILMVIVIAGVAAESAWQRTATNLPLLLVLGLVGFVGGVAVTRFMSRDADDLDVEQFPARPAHPTAPVDESTDPAHQPEAPTDGPTDEPTERESHR